MKITIEATPEEVKEMVTPNMNPQVYTNIMNSWMEAMLNLQKDWANRGTSS